jgi:isopentenyl-diphosphate delta-isomerase type 1
MSTEEIFETVDEDGNVIGRATRSQVHADKSLIHRSVHVHVFDNKGRLFVQKRAAGKDVQPGKWDTSVGGHVDAGESVEQAALREMAEELGIEGASPRFLYRYLWRSPVETELVHTFGVVWNKKITLLESELDDGRFWEPEEIEAALGSGIFTPNFEVEFKKLYEHLESTN